MTILRDELDEFVDEECWDAVLVVAVVVVVLFEEEDPSEVLTPPIELAARPSPVWTASMNNIDEDDVEEDEDGSRLILTTDRRLARFDLTDFDAGFVDVDLVSSSDEADVTSESSLGACFCFCSCLEWRCSSWRLR